VWQAAVFLVQVEGRPRPISSAGAAALGVSTCQFVCLAAGEHEGSEVLPGPGAHEAEEDAGGRCGEMHGILDCVSGSGGGDSVNEGGEFSVNYLITAR
jgi:hypothetical protein